MLRPVVLASGSRARLASGTCRRYYNPLDLHRLGRTSSLSTPLAAATTAAAAAAARSPSVRTTSLLPHAAARYAAYSTASVEAVDPDAARVEQEAKTETDQDPYRKLGYLYFDSAFPIRLGFWDLRYLLARFERRSTLDRIKASLPHADQVGHGFKVIGAEQRMKDGGAFVTFSYREDPSTRGPATIDLIEKKLQHGVKRVFNPSMLFIGKPGVHVVRGKPFREDMNIFPATRIFVKLEGGDASVEQLWEILRPYGRILSIEKDKPSEALVSFSRMRGATCARNCAYGMVLGNGARMVLTFRGYMRGKQFWNWISSHPKIVFPVMAFLLGGLTYVVFDPIRAFMVESKIRNTFSLDDYKIYAWLKDKTVGLFKDEEPPAKSQDDWWERWEAAESIREWIRERPSTFITISGPRGSGKSRLLEKALTKDVQHLVIDCENIARTTKNDATLVSSLATETGYWPVFGWLNSLNNMIDLAAIGLIGSKAGFATPVEAQLRQVLGVVGNSLNHLNEETQRWREKERKRREKAERQAEQKQHHGHQPVSPVLSEKGAAAPSAASTDKLLQDAEGGTPNQPHLDVQISTSEELAEKAEKAKSFDVPVVVIQKFHHKGLKQAVVHTALAEWAAEMVTNGVAHVIFVSDNPVSMGKELTKALPNVPFQSIALADADEDKARSYVFNKLKEIGRLPVAATSQAAQSLDRSALLGRQSGTAPTGTDGPDGAAPAPEATGFDSETAQWVDKLGGRLTDLENLVQKVSIGQDIQAAVEEIISRTVVELRKNAFGEDSTETQHLPWKGSQAWTVIKTLAAAEEVNYYGLLHGSFKGDEAALKALEGAEIISVRHHEGRPSVIRAGRPVLREAMQRMVKDRVFNDTQTLLANTASIESAGKQIRAIEEEIRDISTMIQGSPFKVATGGGSTGAVVVEDPAHPPASSAANGNGGGYFSFSLSSHQPTQRGEPVGPAPVVVAPISASEAARARTEFLLSKMATLQAQISKLDAENARIQVRLKRYRET
ncbi:mitochondrial escape protein 2 [Thecaphora frezii]